MITSHNIFAWHLAISLYCFVWMLGQIEHVKASDIYSLNAARTLYVIEIILMSFIPFINIFYALKIVISPVHFSQIKLTSQ